MGSQGCPNQNQHLEQFQNHMEQGLSEAQCHKKADDYRSLCFTTQSHGSGSVTASYEVNGKSKSRAVSSWQNVCSIQVSSCPKQQRELGHVDALHKTHMAKSYVTVTVDGHTVTKTTKAYTHQKCAAAAAKVNDECFDASDQKSTFQQVYTGSQYRPF